MTREIEKTLNLPRLEDAIREFSENIEQVDQVNASVDAISNALERISPSDFVSTDQEGTDTHEKEMDEIYITALAAHKQIFDLAFNVENKLTGSILEPAARFLDVALTASKSKSEQKLKTLKLRMDRQKLDAELQKDVVDGTIDAVNPAGFMADRNDLLKELEEKLKSNRAKR